MKLRFLGQAYSASNHQVETLASRDTAQFLGQSYAIRRPIKTITSQIDVRKKYRGVVY